MSRTIQEIREQFSKDSTEILIGYQDTLAAIKAKGQPEEGGYLDRLSDEQRMGLMREQKMEQAQEAVSQAREEYTAEVSRYREDLARRTNYIREHLFKVEDAGALSRAALATDAELGTLMELAAQASNAELGRAAFVAAEQRGLGDLMAAYFDRIDPEAREFYQEWTEIPPQEILDRQAESVERLLPGPTPEELMQGNLAAAW